MKKFLLFCLGMMMCAALAACGGVSHEEEIKSSVDAYFAGIQAGDYEQALTAAADDLTDNFGLSEISNVANLTDETMGETYNSAANEFVKYFLQNSVKSYTIDSVEENEGQATVQISGSFIDAESALDGMNNVDMGTLFDEYAGEHMDELAQRAESDGEDAVTQAIIDACAPKLFEEMKSAVENAGTLETKMQMTLQENDGTWKITQIDEIA